MPRENTEDNLTDDSETEETTEETTEEDPSTEDDSTEESDTEEESDDSSSDGEEEESDEDVEQILDISKLPPQLREAGRRMQKTLTKGREKQKAQLEKYKTELEEQLNTEYSRHIQQSKGFEALANAPGFREFYADLRAGLPYGHSSVFNKGTRPNADGESSSGDDSSADADGKIDVNKLMNTILAKVEQVVDAKIAPFQHQAVKTTFADAEKNLPNFNKYRAKITQLMQDEGMSIQRAYEVASEKDRIAKAVADALKDANAAAKKLGNNKTIKSGTASKTSGTMNKRTVKDIDEAVSLALTSFSGG